MKLSLALLAFPAYCMAFQVNVDYTSDEVMKHLPKIDKHLIRQNDQVDMYLCDERAWRVNNIDRHNNYENNPAILLHEDTFPLEEPPMVDPDMYNDAHFDMEEDLLRQNDQVDRYLNEDRIRLFHHNLDEKLLRHTDIIEPYLYEERLRMFKPPLNLKKCEILKKKEDNTNDPYVEEARLDSVLSSENQKQHLGMDNIHHHSSKKKKMCIEFLDDETTGVGLKLEDWDMDQQPTLKKQDIVKPPPTKKEGHTVGDGHEIFSYVPSVDDLHG